MCVLFWVCVRLCLFLFGGVFFLGCLWVGNTDTGSQVIQGGEWRVEDPMHAENCLVSDIWWYFELRLIDKRIIIVDHVLFCWVSSFALSGHTVVMKLKALIFTCANWASFNRRKMKN